MCRTLDFSADSSANYGENAEGFAPLSTYIRPPPTPETYREDINVRKWQLDAYCPRTNCGGRVHREVGG